MLYFCVLQYSLKYILTYILVLFCLLTKAQNITSPQIRCVDVLTNGNVQVTWQVPLDPNGQFVSYQIYSSPTLAGPYNHEAGITAYNQFTYQCTSMTNANTQPYFIYIQTTTKSGNTLLALDTIKTLFLSPLTNGPVAQLIWQNFAKPMPAGEGVSYSIEREHPMGTWTTIAHVPMNPNFTGNYTYNDTISICNDTLNYRITLIDSLLHCTSVSNARGGRFQDKNKPSTPYIDSVSVINSSPPQVVMGISPAYSQDVKCFKIYSYNNNTYNLLDSICNYNHSALYSIASPTLDPTKGSVSLSALSQDSCAEEKSVFPNNLQQTIYIHASYDFCKKRALISWTAYQNMTTGVKYYEVYYSTNGGAPKHLGDTTATSYYQNNLMPGTTYCYYVRAHSNGKTVAGKDTASSTSNVFCITNLNPPMPTTAYLSNVTVNAQQTIDISWYVKNTDPIGGFNLYRSTNKNGPYNLIKNLGFTRLNSNYSFTDTDVNPNSVEYFIMWWC